MNIEDFQIHRIIYGNKQDKIGNSSGKCIWIELIGVRSVILSGRCNSFGN